MVRVRGWKTDLGEGVWIFFFRILNMFIFDFIIFNYYISGPHFFDKN
jgi:hypothetical protein